MVWVMGLAAMSLAVAIAYQDRIHRTEIRAKDLELKNCQDQHLAAETAFRSELKILYKEVQEFREEIYRQAASQQRTLKRLKR